ncbi:hypothetical protein Hanom_Chr13g01227731 [Helianthus anomalus]
MLLAQLTPLVITSANQQNIIFRTRFIGGMQKPSRKGTQPKNMINRIQNLNTCHHQPQLFHHCNIKYNSHQYRRVSAFGSKSPHLARAARSFFAAATMFSSAGLTSAYLRVLSPQSGFTHKILVSKTASILLILS